MALANLFKRGALLKEWYLPSRLNNFKLFSRVVINTEDEATIFINVLLPKDPEFVICNYTEENLQVS